MYIQILQVCYFEQLSALMNKLQKKSYFESGNSLRKQTSLIACLILPPLERCLFSQAKVEREGGLLSEDDVEVEKKRNKRVCSDFNTVRT